MTEAPDGADGEQYAVEFAQEIDAVLAPLLMAAAYVAEGGPFALRRGIDLAKKILTHAADARQPGDDPALPARTTPGRSAER